MMEKIGIIDRISYALNKRVKWSGKPDEFMS